MEDNNPDNEDEEWSKPVDEIGNQVKTLCDHKTFIKAEPAHPRVILHIDIDCFYAQVEMLRNPDLKCKPLGIQQKYIIVTCNYVAREQGLTKLMTVKDAMEKCPNLVLVSGEDLTNYRHMSYKISNYLQKYCPLVERLGFDENFLDITELVNDRILKQSFAMKTEVKGHLYMAEGNTDVSCLCGCKERLTIGSHIAEEIRTGLYQELGITSCGGIAHNKLLSKLVAGTHKPNQQTTLYPHYVNLLMSGLKSVRNIQGIGHTTARRLKELGVVTVADLQNIDQSVLEEEFGHAPMETMKKLCIGIDDSPVIAFGLPQTLSDEDSFKKCSKVEDVKSKIKQLINSLLHRLLEDGRTPQTLRLSVRRMLETNRYNNRESRQCIIPSSVFNKFSTDNLVQASNQLEALAYGLFTKMVTVKSPFHLTLINVAFAKLEQKSSNDITSFFSPKKRSSQRALTQPGESQSVPMHSGSSQTSVNGDTTSCKQFESNASFKHEGLGLHDKNELSPRSSSKTSVSGIQKWLVKQPTRIVQYSNHSDTQTSGSTSLNSKSLETKRSLKREATGESCDEQEEKNRAKRKCNSLLSFKLPENVAEILPQDVDLKIFLELPPDIQKDIIDNTEAFRDFRNNKLSDQSYKSESGLKCNSGMPSTSSLINKNDSLKNRNNKKNTHTDGRPSDFESGANGGCSSAMFKNVQNVTCMENSVKSSTGGKLIFGKHNSQSLNGSSKTDFKNSLEASNEQIDADKNFKLTTKKTVDLPNNVDPAIFESLPPEIKEELTQQWTKEKASKDINSLKSADQKKLFFKSPKPSTSNNITDYFSKK